MATAVDQLTSTMNAFGMEGDDAANVVDVFANMAGKTATDVEELATAMARTASIAKNAGMSFE
ncbi:phage tail tape measure protein%2C TP901 family%2C core region [Chlamydia trachomatis]|nr:phage tail tape measure protein%2C TP901 family%2C core region [Chlamydia trachomatis]